MADMITLGDLQVRCRFTVVTLQKCRIQAKYGEHTKVEIICTVRGEETRTVFSDIKKDNLEIFCREDSGREQVLFAGIIQSIELIEEGRYAALQLKAISNTWKMDIKRKSRSFQNVALTYQDIAREITKEYNADMRWNALDKSIQDPLIQYQETDYCFLKRILSHLHGEITSEDIGSSISFWAGMKKGTDRGKINLNEYVYSTIWYAKDKWVDKPREMWQLGYLIEGRTLVNVGDLVQIGGRNYYVTEAETLFERNVLCCKYKVFPKKCFETETILADNLRRIVITGKVLETKQEYVKMHLDIDKKQLCSEAYDFPWKPFTGNLLYCMPEVGTRVALYFSEGDEKSAVAVMNVRENGEQCGELTDYHNRYFTTKERKRMYLKPEEIGLLNMANKNAEIALKDGSLLQVKTIHQLSVLAEGQVELKGRNVTITTPKEATLVRKDVLSPTVINLCNAFDAIGKRGNFASTASVIEKQKRMLASGVQCEKYSLQGAVSMILSNIPAAEEGNTVAEAIAGSMPDIIFKSK